MAIGDLYLVEVEMDNQGAPAVFTLGYEQMAETGDLTGETASVCGIGVGNGLIGLEGALSDGVRIETVAVRKLTGTPEPYSKQQFQQFPGLRSGQPLPNFKAIMVTHKQSDDDVTSNGKSYVSGLSESDCDGDDVSNPAVVAAVQSTFDNLLTLFPVIPAGSAEFRMRVLQRTPGQGGGWNGLTVTSNSVRSKLFNAYRRRTRRPGFVTA